MFYTCRNLIDRFDANLRYEQVNFKVKRSRDFVSLAKEKILGHVVS